MSDKLFGKSVETIEKLQLPNGGVLASPPGKRYPYVYPRDHVICLLAFIDMGLFDRAKRALDFMLKAQLRDGSFPQRYDTDGKDASYKPKQIDGNGLVLYSLCKYFKATDDKAYILKNWKKIEKNIALIESHMNNNHGLIYTFNSIHEFPPIESGYEIWANAICCSGMIEAAHMAKHLQKEVGWQETASTLKKNILKYMWNSYHKCFVKAIRVREGSSVVAFADPSAYSIADFGLLKDSDSRVRSTVERIVRDVWHPKLGGICRYPKNVGRNNAGWGPWPHFTLMIARHFIRTGNKAEADRFIRWVSKAAYKGELPEHISLKQDFEESFVEYKEAGIMRPDRVIMYSNIRKHPAFRRGRAYAVLPLAWPHAEFVRTWLLYKEVFKAKGNQRKA